jgi:GTPase SAR1 family protein
MSTALNTYPDSLGCPARLNPLAVARTDSLAFQFERGCWESALEKLSQLQFRAAIVGPKGSGKTTLLEQLQLRLVAMGYHCALRRAPRAKADQAALVANAKEIAPNNSAAAIAGRCCVSRNAEVWDWS